MTIWLALLLITVCALLWDAGIVLQKIAVTGMPVIRAGKAGRSLGTLLRSGRWMGGLAASAAGWGLFAFALSFTPVSLARAIQGSGFVALAVFSVIFLRHRLTVGEWLGVALVTAGIAALGIAESAGSGPPPALSLSRLLPVAAAGIAVCAVAWLLPGLGLLRIRWVVAFSVMAGTLLGIGDVATRALLLLIGGHAPVVALAGMAAGLIVFYIAGFLLLSRAYQHGRAILVTAVSDLCSRLMAILAGLFALGEPLGATPGARAASIAGYAAVIAGAVLLSRFTGEEVAGGLAARGSEPPGQPAEGEDAASTQVDRHD